MRQLLLDLGHRPALGRDDFLVGAANAHAVSWIDRWPDWPGPALAVYGGPGSGKTHLAQVWRQASTAVEADPLGLSQESARDLQGQAGACLVDGLESVLAAGAAAELGLLHLYNMLAARGGHLLLTAGEAPARLPVRLPDLRSRLAAAPAVELGPPDDELVTALLVKLFADRQLKPGPRELEFVARRVERSFAGVRRLVAAADQASLERGRELTVPLLRQVLDALRQDG